MSTDKSLELAIFVFTRREISRGKKRYPGQKAISGTKSDIRQDIVFMSRCFLPDKGIIM